MKLSIVVAVYNEEKTIELVLDKLHNLNIPIEKEILVIDDGSTDNTSNIVKIIFDSKKYESFKIYFKIPANLGKASALRIGFALCSGDIIVTQDADLELEPSNISLLLEPILSNKTEVVFGSRFYHKYPDSMKFEFKLINKILTFLVNILFFSKITDEATAYKMFKRSVLKNITLTSSAFEYCPEITAKLLNRNYQIIEIPVSYTPRLQVKDKKIKWYDGFEAIFTLIKFRFAEFC
ncbi:MAG TPA: glycosyltransferase family 2 protein [bacterium]|nr:glycosyltransferase family 2 protein [bacterium]